MPLAVTVAGANVHDSMMLVRYTGCHRAHRVSAGHPASGLAAPLSSDKGYDYDEVRAIVAEFALYRRITGRAKKSKPSRKKPARKRAASLGGRAHA